MPCKKCGRDLCDKDIVCLLVRDIKYGNPIELFFLSIIGLVMSYFIYKGTK